MEALWSEKAKALSNELVESWIYQYRPETRPPTHSMERTSMSGNDQRPLSIARSNIDPSRPTYDGLLGYVCDFFLPGNGTEPFYPEGITPAAAHFYLWALNRAGIITRGFNGDSHWARQKRIKGLEDIERRISQDGFLVLLRLYRMRRTTEQSVPRGEVPEHNMNPEFYSNRHQLVQGSDLFNRYNECLSLPVRYRPVFSPKPVLVFLAGKLKARLLVE